MSYELLVVSYWLLKEAEPLGMYSQAEPGNKELLFLLPSSFFLLKHFGEQQSGLV